MKKTKNGAVRVVAAYIRRGERFLIFQRPPHKARGLLWEFVGGKVEIGESDRDALIRECREEIGCRVEPGRLFCSVTHEYPDLTVELAVYETELPETETPRLLEHAALAWITPDEIGNYDFCPADTAILSGIVDRA